MFLRHKAATVMSRLGPRVGVQQKGARNARLRQHVEQISRVTGMYRQIFDASLADFPQQHGDAVDVRLGPNDTDIGIACSLMHQMLTAAKADLKPDIFTPNNDSKSNGTRSGWFPNQPHPATKRRDLRSDTSFDWASGSCP